MLDNLLITFSIILAFIVSYYVPKMIWYFCYTKPLVEFLWENSFDFRELLIIIRYAKKFGCKDKWLKENLGFNSDIIRVGYLGLNVLGEAFISSYINQIKETAKLKKESEDEDL